MHTRHIVHTAAHNEYSGNRPEAFTMHHNGDFSGDVKIEVMSTRTKDVHDVRIYGSYVTEVSIPFEVIKQIVAEYVRQEKINSLMDATDHDILTGGV